MDINEFKYTYQDQGCHLETWINYTLHLGDGTEGEKYEKK